MRRPHDDLRCAAVLAPLRETDDGLELIFTLRTGGLASHAGQVSFPGGRVDPKDGDRWDTALREAHEELGIPGASVTRIGQLDDLVTITHFHVSPCVGLVEPGVELVPDPSEVAHVFSVPLGLFYDPALRRSMSLLGDPHRGEVAFFMTNPHVVWGATGAMIDNLVALTANR